MAVIWTEVTQSVLDMASGIIEAHHPHLLDARVGFIFRSEAESSAGKEVWGKAQKVSDKLKVYLDFDFLIWIARDAWASLSINQKQALLDHELCHCLYKEGAASMRPHDIEEFTQIVDRYGLWRLELAQMANSMRDAKPEQDTLPGIMDGLKRAGAVLSVVPDVAVKARLANDNIF